MTAAVLLGPAPGRWQGDAGHYRLEPPLEDGTADVIVSGVDAMFTGPEVLIFPATPEGEVVSYLEIAGCRGTRSHRAAIEAAGWELA